MPLAFTQEDCLVLQNLNRVRSHFRRTKTPSKLHNIGTEVTGMSKRKSKKRSIKFIRQFQRVKLTEMNFKIDVNLFGI